VITANSVAVVYRKGSSSSHDIYACVQKTGDTRKLGFFDVDDRGVYALSLSGRYVAYIRAICDRGSRCFGRPHVRDLVSNSERNASKTPSTAFDAKPIALPTGSMAWVRRKRETNEIRTFDGATERVVDSGPTVGSLARSGRTIYWLHDGEPRAQRAP
jgi:hypothetical protein